MTKTPNPKTKKFRREFSAGGIVIRRTPRGLRVLLIKDSYGRWTWPKGKIGRGEGTEAAALREVGEETGLKDISILKKTGQVNYWYQLKGARIYKTVYLYLLESHSEEPLKVQAEEIKAAQWFPPEKALETVQYKGAKELLKKALSP